MFGRRKAAAVVAEFLGTATLAFVVLNVSRSTIGIPYFVAFAAGLAVILMGVSIATDVQMNPALTIALLTARRIKVSKAVIYVVAQLLGGWAAYGLYKYFEHGTVSNVAGTFQGRVLVAEAVGTFVFTVAAAKVFFDRVWGWNRAVIVGGAYIVGIIVSSTSSNGFINPAVALGSNSWGWLTYVLGPVLGAIIGINLYGLLFDQSTVAAKKAVPAAAAASAGSSSSSSSSTMTKTSTKSSSTSKKSSSSKSKK